MQDLLKEVLGVGLILVVVGLALHLLTVHFYGQHDLNNMGIYALHLFGAGVVVHLLCEYSGINKWYCQNGNACKA